MGRTRSLFLVTQLISGSLVGQTPVLERIKSESSVFAESRGQWVILAVPTLYEKLRQNPEFWDHYSWGDVRAVSIEADTAASLAKEAALSVNTQLAVLNPDGRLVPIPAEVDGDFSALWVQLQLLGASDADKDSDSFLRQHPGNRDAQMERAYRLFLRAAFAKDAKDAPPVSRRALERARVEADKLFDFPDWFEHPRAEKLVNVISGSGVFSTTDDAAQVLYPLRKRLAKSLQASLLSRPSDTSLWELWGKLLPPEDHRAAIDSLDNIPNPPGTPWPPPGPAGLYRGLFIAKRWDLIGELGRWGWSQLEFFPPNEPEVRRAATQTWGRFLLVSAANQGNWPQFESWLQTIRSFLGPDWTKLTGDFKGSAQRGKGPVPKTVIDILESTAYPAATPTAKPEAEALKVSVLPEDDLRVQEFRKATDLILFPERQVRWSTTSDQKESWRILDGELALGTGDTSQSSLNKMQSQILAARKPRIHQWREFLAKNPGHYEVQVALWNALGRRMPSPRFVDEWLKLSSDLECGPISQVWPASEKDSAPMGKSQMARLELKIAAAPFQIKSWKAWAAWNKVLPIKASIASLIERTARFERYGSLSEAMPFTLWEIAATDMVSLKKWSLLEAWSQDRMKEASGTAGSKVNSAEVESIAALLSKARAGK